MNIKFTNEQKAYVKSLKDNIINSNNKVYKHKEYKTLVKYLKSNLKINKKVYKNNIYIDYKIENSKISAKDTIIYSLTPALICKSAINGTCPLYKNKICYALRNELQYNSSILYKDRQKSQWNNLKVWKLSRNFINIKKRYPKIKLLRINESGDIVKKDIVKLNKLANILKKYGIRVYTYTHNKDIKKDDITSSNLTINSSHKSIKLSNRFLSFSKEKIKRIISIKKDKKIIVCVGDCSKCKACSKSNNLTILCKLH